jgi:5-keto 4-deoxyuronate isomerase
MESQPPLFTETCEYRALGASVYHSPAMGAFITALERKITFDFLTIIVGAKDVRLDFHGVEKDDPRFIYTYCPDKNSLAGAEMTGGHCRPFTPRPDLSQLKKIAIRQYLVDKVVELSQLHVLISEEEEKSKLRTHA